jgi:AraC-like DNA-binding protein
MKLCIILKMFLFESRSVANSNKLTFDHYFFDLKYYLKPTASLLDFSSLLEISTERVNQLSQAHYYSRFDDLINKYRFNHFINEFNNPVNANISIESVIKLCGFEDAKAFTDYFKKHREIN